MSKIQISVLTLVVTMLCATSVSAEDACDSKPWLELKFLDDFHRSESSLVPRERKRIETERHDFTQSTETVGRGVAQIEAGYSYFYKDEDNELEHLHTTPEMLLRYGLSDDIEFRLRFNYGWLNSDLDERSGSQDLIWSFKLGMTEQVGYLPESALELRSSAPTGGSDFSTRRVDHGLDYIYGWELSERWKLYGSTGYGTGGLDDFGLVPEEPADDWFIVWSQSVAVGTELTEKTTLYNEFFGLFSHALADDFSIVVYNIGIDYYISDNFVFDVRVGKGLTDDSDDLFTGVGGGYRF
ncbi:hypothetical protein CA13_28160 [Planctomycetes bacterium CA13]|uniref:Transporter n=1 Tax=Novipirellula herctigrandis TaxID=2527986 RepID=A0A5C5Z222_9BACT|nr:hypothetical protein CA13_28160 [Planctomycetes bacterium CA13]